ncbi:MAG TPA: DMT family protein [Pirellulaceae bacterium]|nr:DMT family protein [Pirellulaceae bacterium]
MWMTLLKTGGLLILSNMFMTYAWYGHLKDQKGKAIIIAILVSWGVAFFEYLLQVPANRIGFAGGLSLAQLKVMQEVITLGVFVPFALYYMGDARLPMKDFFFAGLCLAGAVYFVFRSGFGEAH